MMMNRRNVDVDDEEGVVRRAMIDGTPRLHLPERRERGGAVGLQCVHSFLGGLRHFSFLLLIGYK